MAWRVQDRRTRYAIGIAVFLAVAMFGWSQLTARSGAQKVAFTPAAEQCGAVGRLKYCMFRSAAGTNGDIVFHLHGRNLDEHTWNDETYWTAMIQAEWQRARIVPPTVISLSFGPTWLLVPRGRAEESGLLEMFMAALPAIEARAGGARRRILLGESMGGLNVLVAGLSHPSAFAKIAALCPGVYAVSPFAPVRTLRSALRRTGADPEIGFGIWLLARRYLADEKEWKRASPLVLVERAGPPAPALYLSNGLYDAYGNFEGTERLAQVASARGLSVEWHPLYGGHCAIDAPSLAQFLVR